MSPQQRELDALMIKLGRAEIDLNRIPVIPYAERTRENVRPVGDALAHRAGVLADLTAIAVARALAGGVE